MLEKIKIYINIFRKRQFLKVGKNCKINSSSNFEGANCIYNNVEIISCDIGYGTYIANNSKLSYSKVGKYCAIGENVRSYIGIHPINQFLSIHPAFYSLNMQSKFTFVKSQLFEEHKFIDINNKYVCQIGNDVWIGNNVTILDGIVIGDGAIIAAGALITKNVEPYTVVGGIPAKIIKKRFSSEQINKLISIKWWDWDFNKLSEIAQNYKSIEHFLLNHI